MALLLLVGHFAPWVAHKTAVLTLSGHDLAVFTHFTPGAGIFLNQWFYLPLWAAALIGALLADRSKSVINRILVAMGCAIIASLGMPGYPQVLSAYRSSDYQLQFFITLAVIVAVFALIMARAGQHARLRWGLTLAILITAIIPLGGYLAVKPAIEQLYNESVGIGFGWWLTLAACLTGVIVLGSMRTHSADIH